MDIVCYILRQDFQQAKREQDFTYIQEMLASTFKSSRDINLTFKVKNLNQFVVTLWYCLLCAHAD